MTEAQGVELLAVLHAVQALCVVAVGLLAMGFGGLVFISFKKGRS